jgi:hypothetical protein
MHQGKKGTNNIKYQILWWGILYLFYFINPPHFMGEETDIREVRTKL